jgi:hypothetical protein
MSGRITLESLMPKPCNHTQQEIESLAEQTVARLGLKPGADETELVLGLGGRVHRVSQYPNSLVVHNPGVFHVYVPWNSMLTHSLYYVACATGYYVLHYPDLWKSSDIMQVPRNFEGRARWEAGIFADTLLVPEAALRSAMHANQGIAVDVASVFDVSLQHIQRRLARIQLEAA